MKKVLFLGCGSREVVLAEKFLSENHQVYVMTDKTTPNISLNIIWLRVFFDVETIISINPDIVFAFSDEYVFEETINKQLHEIGTDTIIVVPEVRFFEIEKNKLRISNLLGKEKFKYVNNKDNIKLLEKEWGSSPIFVREVGDGVNKCFLIENEQQIKNIQSDANGYFVEPYFKGKNITTILYVANGKYVIFPSVFDFPFLASTNEKCFIKTGGIKCEYQELNEIEREVVYTKVIPTIKQIVGIEYVGFLSVQVIVDEYKYHIVEIDIRPGDPEFINSINAVNENITDLFFNPRGDYIIKSYKKSSISVAIASEVYPYCNAVLVLPEILCDNLYGGKIYWSKVYLKDKLLCNYDNGRLCFIFFEGEKDYINRKISEYKRNTIAGFTENRIKLFDG